MEKNNYLKRRIKEIIQIQKHKKPRCVKENNLNINSFFFLTCIQSRYRAITNGTKQQHNICGFT